MTILIVVNDPKKWPFDIPDVEVVEARSYLTKPEYSELRTAKVFNLCKSYRYQTIGYYVSLLAEARGHKPQPSVATIQGMKSRDMIRLVSNELDKLMQTSLSRISSDKFTLSVYFGRNLAKRYDRLSLHLYNLFQSPLLRAQFVKNNDHWSLRNVSTIAANEIPKSHADFVARVAAEHFAGRRSRVRRKTPARYDLAILRPSEAELLQDEKALEKVRQGCRATGYSHGICNERRLRSNPRI
ncbi:MAG: RimK-like ATPgrasp N-terminal domain-containing protein [Pirellulaceae bacterium]